MGDKVVLLNASDSNDNWQTIFFERVWGVTEGNTARRHIVPGTIAVFFRMKRVIAVARVTSVDDHPSLEACDALWERISWSTGRTSRENLPCAKIFWLGAPVTPDWSKADVKAWLNLKENDNVQNGRRVRDPAFVAKVVALLQQQHR